MAGCLILPPEIKVIEGPLVFLAGPIQGAPDWQGEAVSLLHAASPRVHIASPRRKYPPGEFDYAQQVDWETHFLRRAGQHGVIMFWLAREVGHHCERAYAQTTRFELAEWKICYQRDGVNLMLGIEEGFSNARYIRRRFEQDCPGIVVHSTLQATCEATVEIVRRIKASQGPLEADS